MKCPKCKTVDLKPKKLDAGLPALGCRQCDGSLLALLYYRDWAERTANINTIEDSEETIAEDISVDSDTKLALPCPKCAKLMTKFSIASHHHNRIDLCGFCDEAWLDGNEWTLLKSLELAHKLPRVFTDQWQKNVRDEKMEAMKVERLEKMIGQSDTAKVVKVKNWLKHKHKDNKAMIIQFLGSD